MEALNRSAGVYMLKEGPELVESLGDILLVEDEGILLAIELTDNSVRFFVDDEEIGEVEFPPEELRGRIGLFAQDVEAEISDVRVRF